LSALQIISIFRGEFLLAVRKKIKSGTALNINKRAN